MKIYIQFIMFLIFKCHSLIFIRFYQIILYLSYKFIKFFIPKQKIMNLKYFLLIFLFAQISLCKAKGKDKQKNTLSCKKTDYSYYTLSLTWVNEFCSIKNNKGCNDQKEPFVGEGQKPVSIHGFWPNSQDRSYLECLKENGKDYFCFTDFKFNKDLFSQEENDLLKEYWPDLKDSDFWQYQWNKHGTCYLNILQHKLKSPLSAEQIFRDYFMGTIEKVKELNIRLPAATSVKQKKNLANLMNIDEKYFYPICKKNKLKQIRICYGLSDQPKKEKLIACPESEDYQICRFPISIPEQ